MIFYNNFTAPSFIKGLVNPTLIRRKPKTASPKNGLAVFCVWAWVDAEDSLEVF